MSRLYRILYIQFIYINYLLQIGVYTKDQCPSIRSNPLKFSLTSLRNATGHWIAKVQLEHEVSHKSTGPWEVDIDHITSKCENKGSVLVLVTVAAPPKRPNNNYEFVPGLGYYKFHEKPDNWNTARQICEKEEGHLVIINSDEEFKAMNVIWNKYPRATADSRNAYSFVGVSDTQNPKEFMTIFNEPLNATGYTNWHPSQPNYDGHCLVVERTGQLHDTNCEMGFPYFCEYEI